MAASKIAMTSAGSTLEICLAQPATETKAGYEALSFVDIGEVTSIPSHGKTYDKVEHRPLKSRRVRKLKGGYDQGAFTVPVAYAPGDDGQLLVIEALDMDASVSFCETLQDGTKVYYQALVMSYPRNIGSTGDITAAEFNVEVDSDEVIVYPV